MIQKDFVLRMIQQFIDTILKLQKLIDNHDDEQFAPEFDGFLEEQFGLSIATLNRNDVAGIADKLAASTGFSDSKHELVRLFLASSAVELFPITSRISLFALALQIHQTPALNSTVSVFEHERATNEMIKVSVIAHHPAFFDACYRSILAYCLSVNQIAHFEDLLFEHFDTELEFNQLKKIGAHFYDTLQGLDASQLAQGHFSVAEITEGQNRLTNHLEKSG